MAATDLPPQSPDARRKLFGRVGRRHVGETAMAMIQPQKAIAATAAARPISERAEKKDRRSPDRPWQAEAYLLVDEVGEAGYIMELTANTVASGELVPMIRMGQDQFEPHKDARITRVDEALTGPRGGRREIKRRLALHAGIGGEWNLLGTPAAEQGDGILWEALSVLEMEIDPQGKAWRRRDGVTREEVPDDGYIARGWIASAAYTDRAYSSMKRALPACREVAVHTQAIDATSKSKIPAGLFYVPTEIDFDGGADEGYQDEVPPLGDEEEPPLEDGESEDDIDALSEKFILHWTAPVEDRSDPAKLVPFLLRGPGDQADNLKFIDTSRELSGEALGLRDAAIERLAKMLDAPPEVLNGKGGLNHWTGYNIDADYIAKFITAIGAIVAEFMTAAYLRPMLVAYEGFTEEQAALVEYRFSTDALEGQADPQGSARALWDRRELSGVALVKASGYDPVADVPDEAERAERIALDLITKRPDLAAQLLPMIRGFEAIVVPDLHAPGAGPIGGPTSPAPVAPPASDPAPIGAPPGGPPAATALIDRLVVAADSACERAMERAGARLVQQVKDPAVKARFARIDKADAFTVLGPADVHRMGITADTLFANEWDRFALKTREWVRDFLTADGLDVNRADDDAALAVSNLVDSLTGWLVMHLHSGLPKGANGCRVPDELVSAAVGNFLPVGAVAG